MRYVVSDIHGNYNLFVKLLKKINFTKTDTLFVLGDVIDKGKGIQKLLNLLFGKLSDNCVVLAGNHEYELTKFVTSLIIKNASDEEIVDECKKFLSVDTLTLQDVDNIMNMPYFYEEKDFILVHAGVPFDKNGNSISLQKVQIEDLVYDRRFKNPNFLPENLKCVIFGHTPTFYIDGKKGKIIKYQKPETLGNKPSDFYKIQIDTGNYLSGILGCLCLDNMQEFYVDEFEG